MSNSLIFSKRNLENATSFSFNEIMFEWEDQIADTLGLDFICPQEANDSLEVLKDGSLGAEYRAFGFDMAVMPYPHMSSAENMSVCIIDFYLKEDEWDDFISAYRVNDKVFITSREVYEKLIKYDGMLSIEHMPVTLPDKYALDITDDWDKRPYDVVVVGNNSPVLKGWLDDYEKSHDVNILRRGSGLQWPVYSSKNGFVGYVLLREHYFELLKQCKVVLYSTSGLDGSRHDTNGYHQVTPRFLEYLSCGCNVIAKYDDNADTDYFELGDMSFRVTDYNSFEAQMDRALESAPNLESYSAYLKKHYTSTIIDQIGSILI